MNDLNILKHRLEDLEVCVERLQRSIIKSKCLVSDTSGAEVALSAGVSVSSGGLHYECMVIDGKVQDITIYINDQPVNSSKTKVLIGDLPMKNRYIYAIKAVAQGVECGSMVLRLDGAGLKVI